MALLRLALYQVFTASYLDPNAPTKALSSMDGNQITLIMGEMPVRDVSFGPLADLHSCLEAKGESMSDDIQVLGRISFHALVQRGFHFLAGCHPGAALNF